MTLQACCFSASESVVSVDHWTCSSDTTSCLLILQCRATVVSNLVSPCPLHISHVCLTELWQFTRKRSVKWHYIMTDMLYIHNRAWYHLKIKKNNIRHLRIHDVLVIPPKTGPIHGSNFIKSWPIFKIISPLEILVNLKQDAQLSQRDRAAGYISFGRKWKTGTQRQYFTDIVSLSSTTVT